MRRIAVLGGLLTLIVVGAMTAVNVVPSTALGDGSSPISANDTKPPECGSLDLGSVRAGSGGGGGNTLILGTAGADSLSGGSGDDCIVGGDGDDVLRGNAGFDVCVGGPGNDTFHASCEVRVQ